MEALHRQGQDRGDHDDADPGQEQEWLRESDLINGGLILIGVYMAQPFLGVGMGASGLVAVAVHAAGYLGLNQDQTPTAQETRASGDSDA